jgi:hypothetical protein
MLTDIGNFAEKGIDTHGRNGIAEGFKVHVRGTGGNDDGIETEFVDLLMNQLLSRFAAHVFVMHGTMHAGHFGNFFGNPLIIFQPQSTVLAMFSPHQQVKTPIFMGVML